MQNTLLMKIIPHNVEAWNPNASQWQVWERYPGRNAARKKEAGIQKTLRRELQIIPALTQVVPSHRSRSSQYDQQGLPRAEDGQPQPQNPFAYFFHDQEGVLDEIKRIRVANPV